MKFYMMHLMPYADLDLDYDQKHNSAWITLPNSYYDPKKGAKLYNRYLDELEYADQLGFDGVCVNEHHQTAYGLMPQPGVMAGALARRTRKVKIAILGRALPLLNNPVTVAEEFAMVDNITEGRFIAGFVRGIGAEYHAWSSNPADSHDRFHEAHDLIIRPGRRPALQLRGQALPVRICESVAAALSDAASADLDPLAGFQRNHRLGLAPDRRYTYLQTFTPVAMLAKYMQMYKDKAAEHGYEATPDQLGWSVPLYVAETDEIARREAQPHIENFLNKFLRMPKEMLLPPGYLSLKSMMGVMKAKSSIGTKQTIDAVIEKGMFICGSPETVRAKLEEYQSEIGFGHLLTLLQFGTLPAELTRKNMELYANEVMPYLRQKVPPAAAAQ
jgi:alkanesulfonate monooxygenase SsuD/methylene tetrahydromethanopterin reductase-like flavin-dependent oxidoreductase (luciferase family)